MTTLLAIVLAVLLALSDNAPRLDRAPEALISDVRAYCRSAGTTAEASNLLDRNVVLEFANAYADAWGMAADAPSRLLPPSSWAWRCVDGHVLYCSYGNNIPCTVKADWDPNPSQALIDWCAGSSSWSVPTFIAGNATAFNWQCIDGKPATYGPPKEVDAQGYFTRFWYRLPD